MADDSYVTDYEHETASSFNGQERFVMYDTLAGKTASIDDVAEYILGQLQFTDSNSDGNVVISGL